MKVGIVGCGVMGGACARIISKAHDVVIYNHKQEGVHPLAEELGATSCTDLQAFALQVDAVILAVKPKQLAEVAAALDVYLHRNTLLISVLAGTSLETLRGSFKKPVVFRIMPNLPLVCGKGVIGVVEEREQTQDSRDRVVSILGDLGKICWLPETAINAFTALTGSNPAFIYLVIEAMIEAGISIGMKAELAQELVLDTIEGSVELLRTSQESPQSLRWKISSPAGTTIAGLNTLEACQVRHGIISAIQRCYEKAHDMEAKNS